MPASTGPDLSPFLSAARAALGRQVTYARGGSSITLQAIRGTRDAITTDAEGQPMAVQSPSWILRRTDLVLSGAVITPAEGDTITTTTAAGTEVYRVTPDPGTGRVWASSDPNSTHLRINTTRVS